MHALLNNKHNIEQITKLDKLNSSPLKHSILTLNDDQISELRESEEE